MLYLIDGYNLLYAMGVLRKRMGPDGLERSHGRELVSIAGRAYHGVYASSKRRPK